MQHREDRFTVRAFDCLPNGGIKLNALMQYLQEAAARHAEQIGFGFADLDRQGCFWILSNLRIELAALPRWRDDVTIRTWPSGFTRATASREFIGEDPDGREIFRAASEWMVLDKHSGRPRNVTRLGVSLPADGPKAFSAELRRLQPLDGYTEACTLLAPFSALDFNGHVNNTEYVRWALDGLSVQLGHPPQIRAAQVTYLAEAFQGDEIKVLVSPRTDDRVSILERKSRGPDRADVCLLEIAC